MRSRSRSSNVAVANRLGVQVEVPPVDFRLEAIAPSSISDRSTRPTPHGTCHAARGQVSEGRRSCRWSCRCTALPGSQSLSKLAVAPLPAVGATAALAAGSRGAGGARSTDGPSSAGSPRGSPPSGAAGCLPNRRGGTDLHVRGREAPTGRGRRERSLLGRRTHPPAPSCNAATPKGSTGARSPATQPTC